MLDATLTMPDEPRHLGAFERLIFLALCYLSGALFWRWGFGVLGPSDPLGAVSLLNHAHPVVAFIAAAALCAIVALVATLIQGRRMPLIGPFIAAWGLAILSLRGGTATYLVLDRAGVGGPRGLFVGGLVLESMAWFLVIAITLLSSEGVARRLWGLPGTMRRLVMPWRTTTLVDSPVVGDKRKHTTDDIAIRPPLSASNYFLHVFVGAVAGFVAVIVLSTGYQSRGVEHGQACFLAGASMAIGTYTAHRVQPVELWAWSLPSVAIVAMAGFAWTFFSRTNAAGPLPIPGNPFLTVLPIQFISAGAIGVILMVWYLSGRSEPEPTSH